MARSTRTIDRRFRAGGYTLAESMIASVVLAAAVVGIAGTLAASYQQNADRDEVTTALNLAQQLMEEIASKPVALPAGKIDKPGWGSGQTDRRQYDTIDDYHGYTDFSSAVQAANGSYMNLSNDGTFQRTVTVQAGAMPPGLTGRASDFVLVTATVDMPSGQSMKVSQLFTNVTIFR